MFQNEDFYGIWKCLILTGWNSLASIPIHLRIYNFDEYFIVIYKLLQNTLTTHPCFVLLFNINLPNHFWLPHIHIVNSYSYIKYHLDKQTTKKRPLFNTMKCHQPLIYWEFCLLQRVETNRIPNEKHETIWY